MKKVPFVINCHQLDIDVSPSKSWVLEDLDGECYLEKMVRLAYSSDLFNHIYLIVADKEEYTCYEKFSSNNVTVVKCKESDYSWELKHHSRTWNKFDRMYETIPCWNYQLCKYLQIDFVYSIDAYSLMPTYSVMKEAIEKANMDLNFHYIVMGVGYVQGLIYPVKYLEKYYYQDTHKGKMKYLDFNGLKSYVKVSEKILKNDYPNLDRKCLTLGRKESFSLIKSYFQNFPNEYDLSDQIQSKFYSFLNENVHKMDSLPRVINLYLNALALPNNFSEVFERAIEIGRLTVKIFFTKEFQDWSTLLDIMKNHDLHYILKTDGDIEVVLFKKLMESFDIIEFSIDDISIKQLKTDKPEVNFDRVFANLENCSSAQQIHGTPQLGIECILPRDNLKQLEITKFWFNRIDYVYGLSSFKLIGDESPKIQYIKYYHEGEDHNGFHLHDVIIELKTYDSSKYFQ